MTSTTILLSRLLDVQSEAFMAKMKLTHYPYTDDQLQAGETVPALSNVIQWDGRRK